VLPRTATDEALLAEAYAHSNSLLHPRNAALMGEFIKTRNPEVWDQLVTNLKKTPQRAQTEADQARSLAESQIVNFLTQNMGGGDYAEHMIAAGDPIQMASLLLPYLKAGKLIGGAGRTTGGVVREIVKTAMTEMGIESLQTLVENPDAKLSEFEQRSLNYLMSTLGLAAINKAGVKVGEVLSLPKDLPLPNQGSNQPGMTAADAPVPPVPDVASAQAAAAPAAVPDPNQVPEAVTAGGATVPQATWEGNPELVTAGPNATNVPAASGVSSGNGTSPPGFVAQQGGGQPATGGGASSLPPAQSAGSGSGSSSGGSANSAGGGAGTPLQVGGGSGPVASGGQGNGSSGASASGQQGNSSQSAPKASEDGANPHSKDTANDAGNEASSNQKDTRPKHLFGTTRDSVDYKLANYSLNSDHPEGGPKAVWFRKALGFTLENPHEFAVQIKFDAATAIETVLTPHGQKYNQIISIQGANGKIIPVKFGWIRNPDGVIRLTTTIPGEVKQ